ncbi:MAG: LPS assembly protein LptD [Geminicoccaceae bacterium]|nr:LPS assembly protein LptD [Geminicoccaceae bacterium]
MRPPAPASAAHRRVGAKLGAAGPLLAALLLAAGGAGAEPKAPAPEPVLLTADEILYDPGTGVITARGEVELSRGKRRLLAREVSWSEREGKVRAAGEVVLIEPTGDAFFGDSLEVTGDLATGVVDRFRALLRGVARIAGRRGTRTTGTLTTLEDAVYSPCPLCADGKSPPAWQIRARKVSHDRTTRDVTYEDARLEVMGVPVLWTPWFRHPDPTVERRSGFLVPTAGTSSSLGLTLEVPYHWVLGPDRDLTFSPIFTTRQGVVLGGEYRELREIGESRASGSVTWGDAYARAGEPARGKELRGHLDARGRYRPAELWDAGFDLRLASDNTYRKRYGFGSEDVLENRVFLQKVVGRDYLGLSGYAFQSLREEDRQATIPFVLPLAEARLVSSPQRWGSIWTVDSSLVALTRRSGLDTRRFSTTIGWELPRVGPVGDLWRLRLDGRVDGYLYDGDPASFGSEGGSRGKGRVVPRAILDGSWPLVGTSGSWVHVLEPTLALKVSPDRGDDDDIPNEDSQVFEFDETNLFEPSRFTGLDRVDGGTRLAYGLRFDSRGPDGIELSGLVGQSFQVRRNDAVPADSGVNKNFSDYVGRVDLRPSEFLDLSYRFRLDRQDFEFRRSDLFASFGPSRLRFEVGWLRLSDEPTGLAPRSREELRAGVRLQMTESLAIAARTRRDLNEGRTVSNLFGLLYTHPCFVLVAGLEQRFTTTGDLDEETSFKIRLSLTNLGGPASTAAVEE